MNAKKLTLATLLLFSLVAGCQSTRADAGQPDMDGMMQRWTEFMTPGEGHAVLAPRVGSWNMKVSMIQAPGMPAEESSATSAMQWIMDGRYVQDTTTGDFGGQSFHGLGMLGYDNLKKAYVGTWVDNFSTGILTSLGHYDGATKTFHYRSHSPDLMFTNGYVPTRSTERWIDADHWVMQSFSPGPDGKEFMNMEIEYARAR